MAREVEFDIEFSPLDRYRRRHLSEKGKILKFIVQYETKVGTKWRAIVRYDTSHGFFHKDLMHAKSKPEKFLMEVMDFNKALTLAEDDIKKNWTKYKETFLQEMKNES